MNSKVTLLAVSMTLLLPSVIGDRKTNGSKVPHSRH